MDSNRLVGLLVVMVGGLELDRWDVVEGAVKPLSVEPVHPPERDELDVIDAAPGPCWRISSVLYNALVTFASALLMPYVERRVSVSTRASRMMG